MQLPEAVTLIPAEDRDPDGLYVLLSGVTHIHPFQIPLFGSVTIMAQHGVGGQDHSIRFWLGYEPLNDTILQPHIGLVELDRETLMWEIYDELNAPEGAISAPSGRTIYINVLNRQNSVNNYRLAIS